MGTPRALPSGLSVATRRRRVPLDDNGVPYFATDGTFLGYIGSCIDMTDRKRAEAEARESERRYREVQMELAHANRLATIGQLTASITHQITQPISHPLIPTHHSLPS